MNLVLHVVDGVVVVGHLEGLFWKFELSELLVDFVLSEVKASDELLETL